MSKLLFKRVVIDPQLVAAHMVSTCGVKPDDVRNNIYTGWSDALLDTLEELYSLETLVRDEVAYEKCHENSI